MLPPVNTGHDAASLADFWKKRYKREHQLIAAVVSLLSRYGTTVNSDDLQRTFLLTLMGHFAVGDAALYVPAPDGRALEPVLAYGRTRMSELPSLFLDDPVIAGYTQRRSAGPLCARADEACAGSSLVTLARPYRVVAPLQLKNKLVGIVFLGPRLNGRPYLDSDMGVLESLASVSAATFNNALLYRNARLSAEELRKLLEVRADVISRISHEFRTPLTMLRAGIEMLPETGDGPRAWIAEAAQRLEQLIGSLLALNESKASDLANAREVDPLAAIHQAVDLVAVAAADKKVRLSISLSNAAQAAVPRVSPEAMRIILDAVLDNAVKYSREGSSVVVEMDVVTGLCDPERDGIRFPEWIASTTDLIAEFNGISDSLDHVGRGDVRTASTPGARAHASRHVVIRVTDEGIGIPAEEIALVAEPFRQASNCPDRGVKGKGLGLALAQRSAAANGGFICCRSAQDAGTTVSIFLPLL